MDGFGFGIGRTAKFREFSVGSVVIVVDDFGVVAEARFSIIDLEDFLHLLFASGNPVVEVGLRSKTFGVLDGVAFDGVLEQDEARSHGGSIFATVIGVTHIEEGKISRGDRVNTTDFEGACIDSRNEDTKKKAIELGIKPHTSFKHMMLWNILGMLVIVGPVIATWGYFKTLNEIEKKLNQMT